MFLRSIPQISTGLELIAQKKPAFLANPWTPGDSKEKKFREVQKTMGEEVRACLACNGDATKVPLARQQARRSNLLYVFETGAV